jgi:hypothetical protein
VKRLILAVALAQMLGCGGRPRCREMPRPEQCLCYADRAAESTFTWHVQAGAQQALACFAAYGAEMEARK